MPSGRSRSSVRLDSKSPEDLSGKLASSTRSEDEIRAKLKSIRKEIASFDEWHKKYLEEYPKLKESLKYYENKEEELIRDRKKIETKLIKERDSILQMNKMKDNQKDEQTNEKLRHGSGESSESSSPNDVISSSSRIEDGVGDVLINVKREPGSYEEECKWMANNSNISKETLTLRDERDKTMNVNNNYRNDAIENTFSHAQATAQVKVEKNDDLIKSNNCAATTTLPNKEVKFTYSNWSGLVNEDRNKKSSPNKNVSTHIPMTKNANLTVNSNVDLTDSVFKNMSNHGVINSQHQNTAANVNIKVNENGFSFMNAMHSQEMNIQSGKRKVVAEPSESATTPIPAKRMQYSHILIDETKSNAATLDGRYSPPSDPRLRRINSLNGNMSGNTAINGINAVSCTVTSNDEMKILDDKHSIRQAESKLVYSEFREVILDRRQSDENKASSMNSANYAHDQNNNLNFLQKYDSPTHHQVQREQNNSNNNESKGRSNNHLNDQFLMPIKVSNKNTTNDFYQSISNLAILNNYLFASCRDGTLKRFNLADPNDIVMSFTEHHRSKINVMELCPSKNLLFTVCRECMLRCFSANTGVLLKEIRLASPATSLTISNEWGGPFMFVGLHNGFVKTLSLNENELLKEVHSVEFDRQRSIYTVKPLSCKEGKKHLLILAEGYKPAVINAYTGDLIKEIGTEYIHFPTSLGSYSNNIQNIYYFLYNQAALTLQHRKSMIGMFDSKTWKETRKIRFDSRDGSVTASFYSNDTIYVGLFDGRNSKIHAYSMATLSLKWISFQGTCKRHQIYAINLYENMVIVGDWFGMISFFEPEPLGPYVCNTKSCNCGRPFARKFDLDFHHKSVVGNRY